MKAAVSGLTLAIALAAPALAAAQEGPNDPWEGFNRDMYAVHDSVDQAVFEPVARGYRAVTPGPVRQGVLNFLRNLRGPVIFANDVLQGEVGRAGATAGRFAVNTTVGILGVFDPATGIGLERHDEDFGQTLAVWGVDSGPYIFIPLLGPSNVRDTTGRIVDTVFDPLTWLRGENAGEYRAARTVTAGIAAREQVIEVVEDIRNDSMDPYVSIRTSYGLLRESAIANGELDVQGLPEFEELPESETQSDDMPAADTPSGEIEQHSPDAEPASAAPDLATPHVEPKSDPSMLGDKT
jgi:phospholipid-binding lipoprotein MlaA